MPAAPQDERAARFAARKRVDWRKVIDTPSGRRVLAELLKLADPLERGRRDKFAQGERNVTLHVLTRMLEVDPRSPFTARAELEREPAATELLQPSPQIVEPAS